MPFSYMSLSAVSNDGRTHTVQLYSDISAEWVSGDNSLGATWSTTTGNTFVHQVQLANQVVYSERNDHIQRMSFSFREEDFITDWLLVSQRVPRTTQPPMYVSSTLPDFTRTRITNGLSRLLAPRFKPAPTLPSALNSSTTDVCQTLKTRTSALFKITGLCLLLPMTSGLLAPPPSLV